MRLEWLTTVVYLLFRIMIHDAIFLNGTNQVGTVSDTMTVGGEYPNFDANLVCKFSS